MLNQAPDVAIPECPPLVTPEPLALPSGAICYHCGYDLAGRPINRPCPECGMSAADALAALRMVRTDRLRELAGGLKWMATATVVGWVGAPFYIGVLMVWSSETALVLALALWLGAAGALIAVGTWRVQRGLAAAFHPSAPEALVRPPRVRWAIALGLAFVAGVTACASVSLELKYVIMSEQTVGIVLVVAGVTAAAWSGRNVLLCSTLDAIARRGGSKRTRRVLTAATLVAVLWGILVTLFFTVSGSAIMSPFSPSPRWQGPTLMALQVIMLVAWAGLLAWSILWAVALGVLTRCVGRLARGDYS